MACSYNSEMKYFDDEGNQINTTDQDSKKRVREKSGGTTPCVEREDVGVRQRKRNACDEREDDKKRGRTRSITPNACRIGEAHTDDVVALKRKSSDQRGDDKKRGRTRSITPNACRIGDAHADDVVALNGKANLEREASTERDGASCTAADPINASNVLECEVEEDDEWDCVIVELDIIEVKRSASADQPKVNRSRGNQINTTDQDSKKRVRETSGGTTPCVVREDVGVRQRKRKACDEREDDKKRGRTRSITPNACRIGDAHTDDVVALKRNSSDQRGDDKKRRRTRSITPNACRIGEAHTDDVVALNGKANPEREASTERDGASCTAADPINASNVLECEVEEDDEWDCVIVELDILEVKRSASADQPKVNRSRDEFEAKYKQLHKLGEGGCGVVYAGIRLDDLQPVAIKYDRRLDVVADMNVNHIPKEVVLMQRASCGSESIGKFAAVALLDWYYVDMELIIVMERPPECMTLFTYMTRQSSHMLSEEKAKILTGQLVEGAIDLHKKGICHQDLKVSNVLIDLSSTVPRLRIIDFGISTLVQDQPYSTYVGPANLSPPEFILFRNFRAIPMTVWQIGTLLYRMLHGKSFHISVCMGGKPGVNPKFSQDCNDFLQLCLTVDPEERGNLRQLRKHRWLNLTK